MAKIVLDLIYGPMVFRLLAGHGSLNDHESEAMIEAIFGGLRQPGYPRSKDKNGNRADTAHDPHTLESLESSVASKY